MNNPSSRSLVFSGVAPDCCRIDTCADDADGQAPTKLRGETIRYVRASALPVMRNDERAFHPPACLRKYINVQPVVISMCASIPDPSVSEELSTELLRYRIQ